MSSDDGIKLSDKSTMEINTHALVNRGRNEGRVVTCNRGLGGVVLPVKIMGNRTARLGRYKEKASEWLILSVSLNEKEGKDVGHTAMVYETEKDVQGAACGFTLQWISWVPVTIFTNDKRELKLVTATLTDQNLTEWGEYLAARRNPAAVRLSPSILQLWISL